MPNLLPPSPPPSSAGPRLRSCGPLPIFLSPGPPPDGTLRSAVCAGLPAATADSTALASASPDVSMPPSALYDGPWVCCTTWVSSWATSDGDGDGDLNATWLPIAYACEPSVSLAFEAPV